MKTKLQLRFTYHCKMLLALAAFFGLFIATTNAQTAPTDSLAARRIATGTKVGIAGLNHDHIHLILNEYRHGNVNIVGIAEPDKKLWQKFGKIYNLPDSLFFEDLKTMCLKRKPTIVDRKSVV